MAELIAEMRRYTKIEFDLFNRDSIWHLVLEFNLRGTNFTLSVTRPDPEDAVSAAYKEFMQLSPKETLQ